MAALSFTTTTSAIQLDGTTYPATITRDRAFTTGTETITATEAAAAIGGNVAVTGVTEVISATGTPAVVGIFRATIAQTFTGMTQTATAEANFSTLHETGLAQGHPIYTPGETLTGVAIASDQMYAIQAEFLTGEALATEVLIADNITVLQDTAYASGGYYQSSITTLFSPGGAVASEYIEHYVTVSLESAALATEVLYPSVTTVLQETAYASDELTTQVVANETLVGSAVASSDMAPSLAGSLTGTATASSSIVEYKTITETLVDIATANSVLTTSVTALETLIGEALATDSMDFAGSVYNTTLHETALATGNPWAKDWTSVAWVLNTESQGLSSYDNFQFTSMAAHNGVLYATSPSGVFKLQGEDDEGRYVDSDIQGGFLDFSTEKTKRVSDVFLGYTGGTLECDVETYDGPNEVYTYTLEERDANAPRNNRMKIGRGLSSRYWRFTFRNVNGADFQIYDTAAEIAVSKRRL